MELTQQVTIARPRDVVYAALNDPEVLKACIPGCKELTMHAETELEAVMGIKIGPVKATFSSHVNLTNLNPPESYTLEGEGKGGAAGFARGSADVKLTEDGDSTLLEYTVKANVGGKLAQIGGRLIDSTTRKLAGNFFEKFTAIVEGDREDVA
jgi:carbon monoxide dehydrogenase subunit G